MMSAVPLAGPITGSPSATDGRWPIQRWTRSGEPLAGQAQGRARQRRGGAVAVVQEAAARGDHVDHGDQRRLPRPRQQHEGNAADDGADTAGTVLPEQGGHGPGISRDHPHPRIGGREDRGHLRHDLDHRQAGGGDAAVEQGAGDRAGAGAEFEHRAACGKPRRGGGDPSPERGR